MQKSSFLNTQGDSDVIIVPYLILCQLILAAILKVKLCREMFVIVIALKNVGGRKSIRPVKNWVVGCWRGICLEQSVHLRMAQLMPLPLTVSCSSKIQIGFTLLVLAHLGSPGKGPLNGCVFVCHLLLYLRFAPSVSFVSDLWWRCRFIHRKVVILLL